MKYIEFVNKIKLQLPSIDLLKGLGYSDKRCDVITKGYLLPIKISNNKYSNYGEIGKLIDNYDVSYIDFGDYTLENNCNIIDNYFVFSTSSYSHLAVNTLNNEILMLDIEDMSVICKCSINQECFLSAFYYLIELYTLRLIEDISCDNIEINSKYKELCKNASGVNIHNLFFEELI